MARQGQRRPVHLRSCGDAHRTVLDLGSEDGSVVVIDTAGWRRQAEPPDGLLFRRSAVTAPLPEPAEHGDLDALWKHLPVVEADRPLVLALLLLWWRNDAAQPIVFVTGPHDAGKTTAARFLVSVADPSTNLRGGTLPSDEREWKARVQPCRVVLIDNASHITPMQSDTLCRIATGGEAGGRALYTDDEAHLTTLNAPIVVTSIGVGALRGDLQSRMVLLTLESITSERRRVLTDLLAEQDADRPAIFRALLDLAVRVHAALPDIDRSRLIHRMTDLELVVRAVDKVLGTSGATRLGDMAGDLQHDVLDADPVAQALLAALAAGRIRDGRTTPAALLTLLTAEAERLGTSRSSGWPRTPKILSEHLLRVAEALDSAAGVTLTRTRSNGVRGLVLAQRQREVPS